MWEDIPTVAGMYDDFICEAERYCAARGIRLSTLGAYAVGDKTLFTRLRNNGNCLPPTMERVRRYMAENPIDSGVVVNERGAA